MKFIQIPIIAIIAVSLCWIVWPDSTDAQESKQPTQATAMDAARITELRHIQQANEDAVFSIPGVTGIGIGWVENGKQLGFVIYCQKMSTRVRSAVPTTLQGVPVRLVESGLFKAY
jgi:hypothetical protein